MKAHLDHLPKEPGMHSWTHISEIPAECAKNEPCILGVDEAGRGPVLGPMVYALAYCPLANLEKLKDIGFADSKTLNEEERISLFNVVHDNKSWLGWGVTSLSPQDISESMLRKLKYNLNFMAHDTTIDLISAILDKGVNVKEVYIDTVGPPDKYQEKLQKIFRNVKITVSKKADALFPIVSAASICAKVTRDSEITNWKFIEKLDIGREFGSGYPSDPNTVKWLQTNCDPVFGYPRLIRFSWSTTDNMLEKLAVPIDWPTDDVLIIGESRSKVFQSFKLEHVVDF